MKCDRPCPSIHWGVVLHADVSEYVPWYIIEDTCICVWYKRSCVYRTQLSVTEVSLKPHDADVASYEIQAIDSGQSSIQSTESGFVISQAPLHTWPGRTIAVRCSPRPPCLLRNGASQLEDDGVPRGRGSAVACNGSCSINETCLSHLAESLPAVCGDRLLSLIRSPETRCSRASLNLDTFNKRCLELRHHSRAPIWTAGQSKVPACQLPPACQCILH